MADAQAMVPSSSSDTSPLAETDSHQSEAKAPANPYVGTKHKIKVDEREQEIPYEELVSGYQLRSASDTRFKEAKKIQREVQEFVKELKQGNLSVLKDVIPADMLRKFSEKELLEYIEYEKMPEADKKRLAAERERDAFKAELDASKEQENTNARLAIESKVAGELDSEIAQAIKDLKIEVGYDVKVTPGLVEHITRIMLAHLEADDDPETATMMPAAQATKRAWSGFQEMFDQYLGAIPTTVLLTKLSQSQRDAIRNDDVTAAVSQMQTSIRSKQQTEDSTPQSKRPAKVSTDDFFKRIEKRLGIK